MIGARMTLPGFSIVLLAQEAGRPALVERALAAGPMPAELEIRFQGFTLAEAALPSRRERIAAALAGADAVVLSHVLVDEAAARIGALLDATLRPDAQVLAINCLEPLLRRTRLGALSLRAGEAESAPGLPPELFAGGDLTAAFRELITQADAMLERIPAAADLRLLLEAHVAWNEPTPENLRGLVLRLAARSGPEPGIPDGFLAPLRRHPEVGLYHPETGIADDVRDHPSRAGADTPVAGTVGLLLQRGAVLAGETAAADAMIRLLEERGLRVLAAFAGSFDFREPVSRWFAPEGIDALVNLSGFPLVGGHNRSEPAAACSFLEALDVPYLTPPALMLQDAAAWERSRLGLLPMETAMQVAIHELEGGIEPIPVQTLAGSGGEAGGGPAKAAIPDRARRFADRLARWIRLRRAPNAAKRILLVVFAFPPGKGSVGTAAGLDVFRSAHVILRRLRDEGYDVEVPPTPEALLALVVDGDDKTAPIDAASLAVGDRLSVSAYERLAPASRRAEKTWGPPPGALNSDGRRILIHGAALGNVFVGVQPSFGFEGDPMQLLFDHGASPHHGFLAFYAWAEQVWRADAVVHLGTHGALEFMPGKQVGLSGACWPDILAGTLPDLYLYAVNNPSEGTIAKRRGSAVTIGHLTPPSSDAGLARELARLKAEIAEFRDADGASRKAAAAEAVIETARAANLLDEAAAGGDPERDPAPVIARLSALLREIEGRRIPVGLHVIDRKPAPEEKVALVAARLGRDPEGDGPPSLADVALRARGEDPPAVDARARERDDDAVRLLGEAAAAAREAARVLVAGGEDAALAALRSECPALDVPAAAAALRSAAETCRRLDASDELGPLVRGLRGGWVAPGPGGDPVSGLDVLPTGRNLHALDPAGVPSAAAMKAAARSIDLLLERHLRDHGRIPGHVGLVLWGLDNIKTHGEGIAQALVLLGVRPKRNSIGRVTKVEAVPLAELGRPRIDVTITASGIFRDIFGLQIELLDRAVRLVAGLDEPPDLNPVRSRTLALARDRGLGFETAATRIFSNAPGAYGTYVDHLVGLSRWKERSDLAGSFLNRKGFAYGAGGDGVEARGLFRALAAEVDITFQNLDSAEVSLTDVDHYFEYLGGFTALAESASGRRPPALVADATGAKPRVRSLEETLRLEVRTKLLNPRWYEALLAHGYEGAEEIRKRLDYTFGWSATAEAVPDWAYRGAHRIYVEDESLRARLRAANPHSFAAMVSRLLEASSRGFWTPTGAERAALEDAHSGAEDLIEGVVPEHS